jgi:hypothetical protein
MIMSDNQSTFYFRNAGWILIKFDIGGPYKNSWDHFNFHKDLLFYKRELCRELMWEACIVKHR